MKKPPFGSILIPLAAFILGLVVGPIAYGYLTRHTHGERRRLVQDFDIGAYRAKVWPNPTAGEEKYFANGVIRAGSCITIGMRYGIADYIDIESIIWDEDLRKISVPMD